MVKKTPFSARCHASAVYVQKFVDEWSEDSNPAYPHIQDVLSSDAHVRWLHLVNVLLQEDDEESVPTTEVELMRSLLRRKASSPDDDGITYAVLRSLQRSPSPL